MAHGSRHHNVDLDFEDESDDELDHEGEEEDIVDEIGFQYNNWESVNSSCDRKPVMDPTFFALHGLHPRYDDVEVKDALFYCNLMLPDELFELLVTYTNTRASIETSRSSSQSSKWVPTNIDEMKKFIASLLLTGVIRKPRIDMYERIGPKMKCWKHLTSEMKAVYLVIAFSGF